MPHDRALQTAGRYRRILSIILVVALGLRLGWVLTQPTDAASVEALPDQKEYLTVARNLLSGQRLFFYDERFQSVTYAYRMPLYPAFVAACKADIRLTRVAQSVADTSTVLAVALLALATLPTAIRVKGSLFAAGLVALNPFLVYFCALVLSETLFTAMLVWGMLLLIVGSRGGRFAVDDGSGDVPQFRPALGTVLWLAGGLIIALSTLVRPSAAPLAIVLGVFAGLACRQSGRPSFQPRWPLPVAATMLLLTLLVLTPWAYRNSKVVGSWVWSTTNSGVTAYDGFNPDATGASNQVVLQLLPQLKQMNEVERSAYLSSRAADFVRENPKRAVELAVIKAGRTWSPVPLSAEYGSWKHRLIGLTYTVPLYLLTLAGLISGLLRRSMKAYLLMPALYFTVVHMASVGSLRYRIPVEPLLAVIAAAGALSLQISPMAWRRAGDRELFEPNSNA